MALPMPPISNHARRPTCTHMMMRRLYGDYTCCLCGRIPPMRWVYLCHQDIELRHLNNNPPSSASLVQDESNYFQSMAALARRLKMNSSIVESIQAGRYTFEQVDVLIAQKEHVNATIRAQQSQTGPAPNFGNVLQSHDPSATSNIGTAPPSIPPGFGNTTIVEALLNLPIGCGFRVCHTCRPQFLERATISLASALNGETPPIMEAEVKYLRVLDANILKNVGLREHVPTHKFIGEPDGSSDWTATSSSDEISSDESSDSCPDAALTHDGALSTPPRHHHHQLAYDTPGRSTASSISLPTPSTPSLPSVPKHNLENHRRSCSTGSEVEVRGGVALTEEAVGNGMPDILT